MSSTRKTLVETIVSVLVILLGLFFCIGGLAGVISTNDLVQDRPESGTGRIVACKTETQETQVITTDQVIIVTDCLPIVQFITVSGKKVEFVAKENGDYSSGFHKGDYVELRYNAANPKDAVIPSDLWQFASILLCCGLFIVALGIVFFLGRKKMFLIGNS